MINETFFRAFRYAGNFRGGSFSSWLFKIARNISIDYLNKRKKKIHLLPFLKDELTVKTERKDNLKDRIMEELENIKPEYKEIILLKDFAGYSIKNIAQITEKSVSAVKTLHHRAIKKLRTIIMEKKREEQ